MAPPNKPPPPPPPQLTPRSAQAAATQKAAPSFHTAPTVTEMPAATGLPSTPRRERSRVKMQAAITLHSDNNFFNGFSTDISDGGVFIATTHQLPVGTEVDLDFSLPSGQKIVAHGVVRWTREVNDKTPDVMPGLGVQFTKLDAHAQQAIHAFIREREPMFFPD